MPAPRGVPLSPSRASIWLAVRGAAGARQFGRNVEASGHGRMIAPGAGFGRWGFGRLLEALPLRTR